MARVFVSHSSADNILAATLHEWLASIGHEVFFDRDFHDGLVGGEDWNQRLHERLRWADAVVCVLTSAYRESLWCAAEVAVATSRGSRVVPVRAELGITHPLIPNTVQHIDYVTHLDVGRKRLAEALRRAGGRAWPDDRSPYPGFRAFDPDWRGVFFGRTGEVKELSESLRAFESRARHGMTVVLGPSGCGKSSLVRAGLLPTMSDESGLLALPPVEPLGSGANPVWALARSLATLTGPAWTVTDVFSRLASRPEGLLEIADHLVTGSGARSLLLVLDQFEELFVNVAPPARYWMGQLLTFAAQGPVHIVATLRPEYHRQVFGSADLAGLEIDTFVLRPLSTPALHTIIEQPAEVAGLRVDRDLVDRLVDDTGSGDALPLLAFTLAELAKDARRGDVLTIERYQLLGGVRGAVTRQAEAALAHASTTTGRSGQQIIADMANWLVNVDREGHPSRRRVNQAELPHPVAVECAAFTAARLLTTDTMPYPSSGAFGHAGTDAAGHETVTVAVAHEAFFTAWQPLATAIAGNAKALRARQEIEKAAEEWGHAGQRNDRPRKQLWEGNRLAVALEALGISATPVFRRRLTARIALTTKTQEFLVASIRHTRARRTRAFTVLSTLLVAALVAAVYASVQRGTAQHQQRIAIARLLSIQADCCPSFILQTTASLEMLVWNGRLVGTVTGSSAR